MNEEYIIHVSIKGPQRDNYFYFDANIAVEEDLVTQPEIQEFIAIQLSGAAAKFAQYASPIPYRNTPNRDYRKPRSGGDE